ncbi:MAG: hypothetical protein HC896_07785 [Bacteroidales bacterium]|nr:hypothetical protein [Bacteroidales bacterium]
MPLNKSVNNNDFGNLIDLMPTLIRQAQNMDASLGGKYSKGADVQFLVMGFVKEGEAINSIQQFLEPKAIVSLKAEYFLLRAIKLMEAFDLDEAFIDKDQPPQNETFNTIKEAKAKALGQFSSGYIIVENSQKYVLYHMTTADLVWLAKNNVARKHPPHQDTRALTLQI